jgi:hypothetical protein
LSYGLYGPYSDKTAGVAEIPCLQKERVSDRGALRVLTPTFSHRDVPSVLTPPRSNDGDTASNSTLDGDRASNSTLDDEESCTDYTSPSEDHTQTSSKAPVYGVEAVLRPPAYTGRRKSFLHPTVKRQQAYRVERLAERERRIKERTARGDGYGELLKAKEDTLGMQYEVLMKLAAIENEQALTPPGERQRVGEGELRRQRKDHVEVLLTFANFPC